MLLNKIETKALKQPNNECVWVRYMYNETQFSDVLKCDWNGSNTFFFYVLNINLTNCVNCHLVVQQPLALNQKATN